MWRSWRSVDQKLARTKQEVRSGGWRQRHEPLFDGGRAFNLGVVFLFGGNPGSRGDAQGFGSIESGQTPVAPLFAAIDRDLDLGAMEMQPLGRIRRLGFLRDDGQTGRLGLILAQLLEFGLDVLVGS